MSDTANQLDLVGAASQATRPGTPFVLDTGKVLTLHFDPHAVQSAMSRGAPDELIVGYTRTMMAFLLFHPAPEHVAMIGLGGGSLAKYIHKHLPAARFTAVEINPDVLALRKVFAVPDDSSRFRVVCLDGAKYVAAPHPLHDVLIVDGFDVTGQPPALASQAFYDACCARLTTRGVMVVNLWNGTKENGESILRMRRSFGNRVLHVPAEGSANKIVFAWKDEAFAPSELHLRHRLRRFTAMHNFNFLPVADAISAFCAARLQNVAVRRAGFASLWNTHEA